jgi:hypothetical protein
MVTQVMTLIVTDACLAATLVYTTPSSASSTLSYNLGDASAATKTSISYSSSVSGCALVLTYVVKDNTNAVIIDGTTMTTPFSTYIVIS